MADVWNFLRDPQARSEMRNALTDSANRGMVAGSLGAPVDMATTLTNLLIAGGGYLGHKTGLLSQPPDLIDSRNVPGSSEWIGSKMEHAGAVSPNRNALAEFGMGLLCCVTWLQPLQQPRPSCARGRELPCQRGRGGSRAWRGGRYRFA